MAKTKTKTLTFLETNPLHIIKKKLKKEEFRQILAMHLSGCPDSHSRGNLHIAELLQMGWVSIGSIITHTGSAASNTNYIKPYIVYQVSTLVPFYNS